MAENIPNFATISSNILPHQRAALEVIFPNSKELKEALREFPHMPDGFLEAILELCGVLQAEKQPKD